jgi:hypothetical protein
MKRCLIVALIGLSAGSASSGPSQSTSERHWTKAETNCFSSATADERRFELGPVTRDGNSLFGEFVFTNMSEKTLVPPTVVIRGVQLPDGTFWPLATLQVGDDRKGPWKAAGTSSKVGTDLTLTVPASIGAFGLRIDFAAFEPFLAHGGWGRVTLPTGDAAIIDLMAQKWGQRLNRARRLPGLTRSLIRSQRLNGA